MGMLFPFYQAACVFCDYRIRQVALWQSRGWLGAVAMDQPGMRPYMRF
jgi:hypothetical protein